MHIKNLQKADKLLKRLQSLDKEIIQIEQYAHKIKDMHQDISLSLFHEKGLSQESIMDNDGSLIYSGFHHSFLGGLIGMNPNTYQPTPKTPKETCEITISEVAALQVLGVMVAHKESERMGIVNQLIEMGFHGNNLAPAFTVAELGEMLPPHYYTEKSVYHIDWWPVKDGKEVYECSNENGHGTHDGFPTEAQARAALLIYLLEKNLIPCPTLRSILTPPE